MLAKVSKILMVAGTGKIGNLKGKTLDEISQEDLLANEESDSHDSEIDEPKNSNIETKESTGSHVPGTSNITSGHLNSDNVSRKKTKVDGRKKVDSRKEKKAVGKRVPWEKNEIIAVESFFERNVVFGKVPGKKQCDECKAKYREELKDRSWKNIKY